MRSSNRWLIAILILGGLPLSACQRESVAKLTTTAPAHIERIQGTELSRVTLTEKAVERLGIETAQVRVVQVVRKRVVRGEVVALPIVEVADRSGVWVRVPLPPNDQRKVAQSQPARVLRLVGDDVKDDRAGVTARLVAGEDVRSPVGASERATAALHYVVRGAGHGLVPGQRVRVELPLTGSGTLRKVVPHAAVLYDVHGNTWVYTSPAPRTYVRHQIKIDYIDGDVAVLSDGPPTDTPVVTVGAALLLGTETRFGS
jgi:hypothetical protein